LKKLPISALVVSCNDGYLLEDCLKSLSFCDEIVGVNLESNDNTEALFKRYANSYENLSRVPLVEEIHPLVIPLLKNDWIILIDPDERILEPLQSDIERTIRNAPNNACTYRVPMINFFKNRKLKGTVYGGIKYARLLYKKSAINVSANVHTGIQMKEGYERYKIKFTGENYDKHLWCSSWKQLLEKHKRYIYGEGKSRYNAGLHYNTKEKYKSSIIKFYYSFKTLKGYKDSYTGIVLSFLAARYEFLSWNSLRNYMKEIKK
jgi:hypothetical protein